LAKISLAITISAIDELFWQFYNCGVVSGSVPMQAFMVAARVNALNRQDCLFFSSIKVLCAVGVSEAYLFACLIAWGVYKVPYNFLQ
jgi:hypothetical protein